DAADVDVDLGRLLGGRRPVPAARLRRHGRCADALRRKKVLASGLDRVVRRTRIVCDAGVRHRWARGRLCIPVAAGSSRFLCFGAAR
ncbi:MAG: hypothetical protein KDH18_25830, partial [Rhodoferax sp.]|nr:hypothetical protein [Rhodoferax sp.]